MINEQISNIQCQCGQKFQVINEDGTDWDEAATAQAYQKHLLSCGGGTNVGDND